MYYEDRLENFAIDVFSLLDCLHQTCVYPGGGVEKVVIVYRKLSFSITGTSEVREFKFMPSLHPSQYAVLP